MFRVVLAGNANVGKSSFVLRLCTGIFHQHINATLGVDFHEKTLEVDGDVTHIQLWDTVGQERFRSIARSYFRRADGVLLLYDCTSVQSFLSVRDWVSVIRENVDKTIPIMLCGNKTDLREKASKLGTTVVTNDQGKSLASEFGALFLETSVMDGKNVLEALISLASQLHQQEETDVQSAGMTLGEKKDFADTLKFNCCP